MAHTPTSSPSGAAHPGARVHVVVPRELSLRARAATWVIAVGIVAVSAAGLSAVGGAPIVGGAVEQSVSSSIAALTDAATGTAASGTVSSGTAASGIAEVDADGRPGAVLAHWDGPATHLDWSGDAYERAEATFVGDRVAAPGDRVERTLRVVNAGPGDAVMRVVLDASVLVPPPAENPDLGDDVDLFWRVGDLAGSQGFSAVAGQGPTTIAELAVARDAATPITVGFAMPAGVTGSRALGAESTELHLDVEVSLQGSTDVPTLPRTGGTSPIPLVVVGVILVGGGLLLRLAARRRRRNVR